MTRSELIKLIHQQNNHIASHLIEDGLTTIFSAFKDALEKNKRVELREFGILSLKERSARQMHNPHTGVKHDVPAKKRLHFKMGKRLQQALNQS